MGGFGKHGAGARDDARDQLQYRDGEVHPAGQQDGERAFAGSFLGHLSQRSGSELAQPLEHAVLDARVGNDTLDTRFVIRTG